VTIAGPLAARCLPRRVTVARLRGCTIAGLLVAAISRLRRYAGRRRRGTAGNPADGAADSCTGGSPADGFAGRCTCRLARRGVARGGRRAVSLLRSAVSLLRSAVSLLRKAISLLRSAVSLLRNAISLMRRISGAARLARGRVSRLAVTRLAIGWWTVTRLLVLRERQARRPSHQDGNANDGPYPLLHERLSFDINQLDHYRSPVARLDLDQLERFSQAAALRNVRKGA
jgi:hypothetical protein